MDGGRDGGRDEEFYDDGGDWDSHQYIRVVGMLLIDIMIVKALLLPLMSMITKVT